MRLIRLSIAVALTACSACNRTEEHQPIVLATADTISLDSCARLDREGIKADSAIFFPDQPIPPVRTGDWNDIKRATADRFTIDVPNVASIVRRKSDGSYRITDFPGCISYCDITIVLENDSVSRSLDNYIANSATWDSMKKHPPIHGGPRPAQDINVGGEQARVFYTAGCPDCQDGQIFAKRDRTVAHISYLVGDINGFQPGLVCRVKRVASTFQWRDTEF